METDDSFPARYVSYHPILLEFLKVWGRIEVEGQPSNTVQYTLVDRYKRFERRVNEYKGYLAERLIFLDRTAIAFLSSRGTNKDNTNIFGGNTYAHRKSNV